jgi:hypothetical protein
MLRADPARLRWGTAICQMTVSEDLECTLHNATAVGSTVLRSLSSSSSSSRRYCIIIIVYFSLIDMIYASSDTTNQLNRAEVISSYCTNCLS